jgi:hypothetical protein
MVAVSHPTNDIMAKSTKPNPKKRDQVFGSSLMSKSNINGPANNVQTNDPIVSESFDPWSQWYNVRIESAKKHNPLDGLQNHLWVGHIDKNYWHWVGQAN